VDWRALLPKWSATAAVRAIRASIVLSGLFAFTLEVIGNIPMATLAAFGSFATLVLASFSGRRRDKLFAHTMLALAGSLLLTVGTAVSSSTLLAAIVTVPVAFLVFFAGVAGPNAASGITAALLPFVLTASSPGTISIVPDRLAGWWLASIVGTVAVLLTSPATGADGLRAAASTLSRGLADQLEASLRGTASPGSFDQLIDLKRRMIASFTATPYRPTGLATTDQALANAIELLEWCTALVIDGMRERCDLRGAPAADRELLIATCDMLRDIAALLEGGRAWPDLQRLEESRASSAAQLAQRLPQGDGFREAAQLAFHAQTIGIAVRAVGADVLIASGHADPETIATQRQRWAGAVTPSRQQERRLAGVIGAGWLALRHASLRSVWFVNSARGALALAAAVAIADLSNVQHGFWVVLGTLSVLRTNAASTGSTALRALAGTVVGFVIGGALIEAIGTGSSALWIALPIAVLVAAYAPGTAPFALGQAAFTVVVAVLFNLLVPVGWKVGVVRIEDVAIGCAVSVVVGILFWPRGVSGVVGDDLADAYRAGGSYLMQAVQWACGTRAQTPDGGTRAVTTAIRLDDALRGFQAEQGAKRIRKEQLWRLVGGSLRLRLTATAIAGLPQGAADIESLRDELNQEAALLAEWYERLAVLVGRARHNGAGPLQAPHLAGVDEIEIPAGARHTCWAIWVHEHLHHLGEHLDDLVGPATHVAAIRRRPWWR
jgi:hypothetical protein